MEAEALVAEVANPLTHRMHKGINTTVDEGQTPIPVAFANKGHHGTMRQVEASDPLRAKGGDTGHGGESLVAFHGSQITSKANYSRPKPGDPCHPLAAGAHPPTVAFSSNMSVPDHAEDGSTPTVKPGGQGGNPPAVAFQEAQSGCREYDTAGTLRAEGPGHDPVGTRVRRDMAVRRLTPRECERLMGFPDDFTRIAWISRHANDCAIYDEDDLSECDCDREPLPAEECPDGHRYRALGNSMAVNCMRWLGERIAMVEEIES